MALHKVEIVVAAHPGTPLLQVRLLCTDHRAPGLVCIAKGKADKKYEFGAEHPTGTPRAGRSESLSGARRFAGTRLTTPRTHQRRAERRTGASEIAAKRRASSRSASTLRPLPADPVTDVRFEPRCRPIGGPVGTVKNS
jgi:hypothetical protein